MKPLEENPEFARRSHGHMCPGHVLGGAHRQQLEAYTQMDDADLFRLE